MYSLPQLIRTAILHLYVQFPFPDSRITISNRTIHAFHRLQLPLYLSRVLPRNGLEPGLEKLGRSFAANLTRVVGSATILVLVKLVIIGEMGHTLIALYCSRELNHGKWT